eukprot:CAMPEP_0181214762 /NCGR_PEP_ID=MMETSP1096-20121128/25638_1 /TAXON_ID=156174 ORGANISM="Chrysochromulina ericina, Strain CCMP281" /NCGR_SAMPLE_ID=MMETSP1096 /ASSEMBLY_ACC=CAM_ASM_000453 /LENGTH=113 /DNA_ID=CAMNT_0023306543 /DNA_START=212 /DNA_END=553 /DNA_ORIENTATION=+
MRVCAGPYRRDAPHARLSGPAPTHASAEDLPAEPVAHLSSTSHMRLCVMKSADEVRRWKSQLRRIHPNEAVVFARSLRPCAHAKRTTRGLSGRGTPGGLTASTNNPALIMQHS